MKKIEVDATGKACPQPVVMAKKALVQSGADGITVLVDNETARDNVKKMGEKNGCRVSVSPQGKTGFAVTIVPASGKKARTPAKKGAGKSIAYLFESDFVGTNRELGKVLANGFLNAIAELPEQKSAIVLISNGVKLAIKKSYVLERLTDLEQKGFAVLICGTCLDFFKIRDKVAVGSISNALEIMECLTEADKVVKF